MTDTLQSRARSQRQLALQVLNHRKSNGEVVGRAGRLPALMLGDVENLFAETFAVEVAMPIAA